MFDPKAEGKKTSIRGSAAEATAATSDAQPNGDSGCSEARCVHDGQGGDGRYLRCREFLD
jgi:hypothetical protein